MLPRIVRFIMHCQRERDTSSRESMAGQVFELIGAASVICIDSHPEQGTG